MIVLVITIIARASSKFANSRGDNRRGHREGLVPGYWVREYDYMSFVYHSDCRQKTPYLSTKWELEQ